MHGILHPRWLLTALERLHHSVELKLSSFGLARMKRSALLFFVFTVVLALATFYTRDLFAPFVAIFSWFFALVVLISMRLRRYKALVFNLAFVFLALALFEAYYAIVEWPERSLFGRIVLGGNLRRSDQRFCACAESCDLSERQEKSER